MKKLQELGRKKGSVLTFISFLSKWDLQDPLGSPRNSASSLLFLCIFLFCVVDFTREELLAFLEADTNI